VKHFKIMRQVTGPAGVDFAATLQSLHQCGSIHQNQITPHRASTLVRLRHQKAPVGLRVTSRHEDEVRHPGFA
jgi:hypothetical protein